MKIDPRSLAIGSLGGLGIALLVLGGVGVLGQGTGQVLGPVLAAGLGAAGAWLIQAEVVRRFARDLARCSLAVGDETQEPPAPTGWAVLDRELATVRQTLADSARTRGELDDLERLLRAQWVATNRSADPNLAARNGRHGLREMFEELRRSALQVSQGAETLTESTERMAAGAADQTETVAQTTTTVEALSDRIDRISQNAEEAAQASQRARQEACRGLEQIRGIIAGMDRLRNHVETNVRKARRLGERSMEIGAIIELITGISSRTDMLALNATIESVRAGEHGRGFAVVAEEIRKLAERTASATREIGTLVEAIQADARESIRASAEEQAEMERETQGVREAGAALERINQVAEHSARLVEAISGSANDQVLATQDLVLAIQRIAETSRSIVQEMSQVRQDIQDLGRRCRLLPAPSDAEDSSRTRDKTRFLPTVRPGSGRRPQPIESSR